ncbi:hypothetical protein K488DRAFT_89932 [Vararia minispora EC-137]|uniref:Uncharacterized protein n=1 Tax=Vararia minispora EC-137 TaxID=1314806 RepID=A0ACB8Q9A0_9AGAM|nr:hypothetical protein K488DRAFT_89932 [Vararia minispora EC-137]
MSSNDQHIPSAPKSPVVSAEKESGSHDHDQDMSSIRSDDDYFEMSTEVIDSILKKVTDGFCDASVHSLNVEEILREVLYDMRDTIKASPSAKLDKKGALLQAIHRQYIESISVRAIEGGVALLPVASLSSSQTTPHMVTGTFEDEQDVLLLVLDALDKCVLEFSRLYDNHQSLDYLHMTTLLSLLIAKCSSTNNTQL